MPSTAIVILAGGAARRLPRKLERPIGNTPLLLSVYANFRGPHRVVVSVRNALAPALDAALDCTIVVDRWSDRGPLGGLATAAGAIDEDRIFAVAGDAPNVTLEVLHALQDAWQPGDEAAVPEHPGGIEPLAALYDRRAFLRVAPDAFAGRSYAMHGIIDRLRTRRVPIPAHFFININTEADLARAGMFSSKGSA